MFGWRQLWSFLVFASQSRLRISSQHAHVINFVVLSLNWLTQLQGTGHPFCLALRMRSVAPSWQLVAPQCSPTAPCDAAERWACRTKAELAAELWALPLAVHPEVLSRLFGCRFAPCSLRATQKGASCGSAAPARLPVRGGKSSFSKCCLKSHWVFCVNQFWVPKNPVPLCCAKRKNGKSA